MNAEEQESPQGCTPQALVERVARAACTSVNSADTWEETGTDVHEMVWFPIARAAIAVLRPALRAEALEEAAKVAKGDEASATEYYRGRVHAAAAICAMIPNGKISSDNAE